MPAPSQISRNLGAALKANAQRTLNAMRTSIRGTTVGSVRAINWPEAPAQSSPPADTILIHVVDVRLIDEPDTPIARDVLIGTQARQLIGSGSLTELEEGTPVTLEYDQNGQLQITGRTQITTRIVSIDTYELGEFDLEFTWGLQCSDFSTLTLQQQIDINAARAAVGLAPLNPTKEFSLLTNQEIEDVFGLNITDYNAKRAETEFGCSGDIIQAPLPPISAQDAVNLERTKKGQAPFPDDFLAMDVCVYVDFMDAITVGTSTLGIPGIGRFKGSQPEEAKRTQIVKVTLYGSTPFIYGIADYGENFVTYTV